MNIVKNIVVALEGVSYLCDVGLLVVAILGLRQFTLSKRTLRLNSKRDALKITNDQIALFFGELLNEFEKNKISKETHDALKALTLTKQNKLDWPKITKKLSETKLISGEDKKHFTELVLSALVQKRIALNRIEAFSSGFTSGLGDEKTACTALGKAYCNTLEDYINVIKFNNSGRFEYYKNTLTLYNLWSLRMEKQAIEEEINELELEAIDVEESSRKQLEELKKMKTRINKLEDREIASIGVEE